MSKISLNDHYGSNREGTAPCMNRVQQVTHLLLYASNHLQLAEPIKGPKLQYSRCHDCIRDNCGLPGRAIHPDGWGLGQTSQPVRDIRDAYIQVVKAHTECPFFSVGQMRSFSIPLDLPFRLLSALIYTSNVFARRGYSCSDIVF